MSTPPVDNLSASSARIVRSLITAIRPHGSGFDQPIDDDVLREIDAYMPFLPAPLRFAFPLGLRLLEWGPCLFARPRRLARLSALSPDEAERYLEGWLEAGGLRSTLLMGVRTLVFMAFYQHPQVLASLGVDWAGRADILVARRAELLERGPS